MQVGVCIRGEIVIDGNIDLLNVDSTAENVSCNADTLLEVLEFFVAFDPSRRQRDSFLDLSRQSNLPLFLVDT